jgi:hypothetical protein
LTASGAGVTLLGMSKHHPHTPKPPPELVAEPGEPLPEVPAEAYAPDSVALPDPFAIAYRANPGPVDALVRELGALPETNEVIAIRSNAGAGYYADKPDHLAADLCALSFSDPEHAAAAEGLATRAAALEFCATAAR